MEHQDELEHGETAAAAKEGTSGGSEKSDTTPGITKRTPRMLHESSFATSGFTSGGGSRRPPGFAASSLDYKVNYKGGASATNGGTETKKLLNPKPSNRKAQPQQQQDNQQQKQQAKQVKPMLPTRAKGNYGPPPHQIASLEDLEHMTEDQVYRLFMEDPELYRSLLKSTGEGRSSSSTSSDPDGSRKDRSNSRPYQSGKRNLQPRFGEDKEVPYFQWLVVIALLGVGLYQLRKSIMTDPVKQKRASVASGIGGVSRAKGGKQKKQKNNKEKPAFEEKIFGSETIQESAKSARMASQKKSAKVPSKQPPPSKKKKNSKQSEAAKTKDVGDGEVQVKDAETTQSKEATAPLDKNMGTISIVSENEGEDATWQTVAKSRAAKIENMTEKSTPTNIAVGPAATPTKAKNDSVELLQSMETPPNQGAKPNGKEKDAAVELTVNGQPFDSLSKETQVIVPNNSMRKKKKKTTQPKSSSTNEQTASLELETASMDDDAALALQLQREEEFLARALTPDSDLQEDAWEEVTSKKKRW